MATIFKTDFFENNFKNDSYTLILHVERQVNHVAQIVASVNFKLGAFVEIPVDGLDNDVVVNCKDDDIWRL